MTAKSQRLVRDPDPRARRSLVSALLASALFVAAGLGVVALRVQSVSLAYQLDALRTERRTIENRIRELEIEVATLRSPARVEQRARQLGLVVPARDQIRLAREYVTGGTGLAAARLARIEAPPKP